MYSAKKLEEIGKTFVVKNEAERKMEIEKSTPSFSFSPKTEEMFAKFRMNTKEAPTGGKGRAEKKMGEARKKRGRGRGCE